MKTLDPQVSQELYDEKIKILYKNLFISIPGNFICVTLVFIVLYQASYNLIVLNWYIANIIISLFRFATYYIYQGRKNANPKPSALPVFILGTLISALLWGFCAFYLMPQDNILYQMVLIVIIAGITSGGSQTLYANLLATFLYLFSIIIPLGLWIFMQYNFEYSILGIAISIYLLFMLSAGYRNNQFLEKTLLLRYKNLQLVRDSSRSHKKLQEAYHTIENNLKELKQNEMEISFINRVNEMLQTCQKLNEAYLIIAQSAKDLFPSLSGGLALYDTSIGFMTVIQQWGEASIKKKFLLEDCWALREGRPYLSNAKKHYLCHHFDHQPSGDYYCLPQITNRGIQGMLIFYASKGSIISKHEQQLATNFNDVIKLCLSNIRLHEILHEKSNHDSLTKLYNRHFLAENFPREILRAIREKYKLCVCMIDIDFFKKLNDENGHDAGDEVLKFLGKTLNDSVRETDIACRLGGEEFLLILMNIDLKNVLPLLKKICEKIKSGRVFFKDYLLPQITVSIGVAEVPTHGNTMNDIISAADIALYEAKQKGRDRIEFFKKI